MHVAPGITLLNIEIDFSAILAPDAGGQNVDNVSRALHLRFDIKASLLPDRRLTRGGVTVIEARRKRCQEKNARRLRDLIVSLAGLEKTS